MEHKKVTLHERIEVAAYYLWLHSGKQQHSPLTLNYWLLAEDTILDPKPANPTE